MCVGVSHVQYNTRYVCGRMLYMYSIILVMCVGVSHVQYILVMCVGVSHVQYNTRYVCRRISCTV